MKKFLPLFILTLAVFSAFGQVSPNKSKMNPVMIGNSDLKSTSLDDKYSDESKSYVVPAGVIIGKTNYDLQTNSASTNRLINNGDGTFSAVWIQYQGTNLSAPDRGSGYAYYDGSEWKFDEQTGNETVEGSIRTGWPAIMSNGTNEFVVSHMAETNGLYGHYHPIGQSGSNWAELDVADGTEEPMLWPRAAFSGNNFYVIAVDNYDAATSNIIEGVHFYKSVDAGETWTYYGQLPHFKNYYTQANGDSYAMDARDNYVAIVYFGSFSDTRLWKSDDYGETWTEKVINDFPVDKYDPTVGPVIDCNKDSNADTIVSTDNTGDVIIDSQGKVHVVFSQMVYIDSEIDVDGGYSFFPYTDYLLYWNEDMGEGSFDSTTSLISPNKYGLAISSQIDTIGWVPDLNWNGIKDYNFISNNFPFGNYSNALTSMASLGIDASDNIYVAYSTVMETEGYRRGATSVLSSQQFRAIFLKRRDNVLGTWGKSVNITRVDAPKAECVFPNVARLVDSKVHLIYQRDNEPGLAVSGDEDAMTDNYIVYKEVELDTLTGLSEFKPEINFNIYPNPAKEYIIVKNVDNSKIQIFNSMGKIVYSVVSSDNEKTINLSEFISGTYLIQVINEKGSAVQKFIHLK